MLHPEWAGMSEVADSPTGPSDMRNSPNDESPHPPDRGEWGLSCRGGPGEDAASAHALWLSLLPDHGPTLVEREPAGPLRPPRVVHQVASQAVPAGAGGDHLLLRLR